MDRATTNRIQLAARECFQRCQGHDKPERPVITFLMELRLDPAWCDEHVEQVELAVFQMLATQVAGDAGSADRAA